MDGPMPPMNDSANGVLETDHSKLESPVKFRSETANICALGTSHIGQMLQMLLQEAMEGLLRTAPLLPLLPEVIMLPVGLTRAFTEDLEEEKGA